MFSVKHFLVFPLQRKEKGSIFPWHFVLLRPLTLWKPSLWKGMLFKKETEYSKKNSTEQTQADYQLILVLLEVKHSVRNSKLCQNSTFRSRRKHTFLKNFFSLSKTPHTWRSQRNGQWCKFRYGRWVLIFAVFPLQLIKWGTPHKNI